MQEDFQVGAWLIQPTINGISGNGKSVHVEPKVMQVLVYLAEHAGEVIAKERLIHAVWPDTFVTDDVLTRAIAELRKAFHDDIRNPRVIQTIPKGGYRLILPVESLTSGPSTLGRTSSAGPDEGASRGRAIKESTSRRRAVVATVGSLVAVGLAILLSLAVGGLRHRFLKPGVSQRALPPPPIQSLAVLPFEDLSGDAAQEYFGDGMTDALITQLSKISELRLISRTSVMQYRGTKKPLPQIARELNVDAVVEGTVLRSGRRVRISAKLIQANPEKHLWAGYSDATGHGRGCHDRRLHRLSRPRLEHLRSSRRATLSLVLIIIIFNRLLPFVFFSRTRGRWLGNWALLLRLLIYLVLPVTLVLGFCRSVTSLTREHARARQRRLPPTLSTP